MTARPRALRAVALCCTLLTGWIAHAVVAAASPKASGADLPAMPGAPAAGSSSAPAHDTAVAAQSVVTIERQQKPVGLGALLAGDGRVLTAFSLLGDAREVDVRFADGSSVRARVEQHDLGWDLALLVPAGATRSEGLRASERDPTPDTSFTAFAPARRHVAMSPVSFKGHKTLVGAGDAVLRDALELSGKVAPSQLGSPIVDDAGGVVAVVARACAPQQGAAGGCTLVPFGVPRSVLRGFLRGIGPRLPHGQPWLGMQVVADSATAARGVRVTLVRPAGPADVAGLHGGPHDKADLVVAVDGVPVSSPEALSEAIAWRAPGEEVALLVLTEGKFREVSLVLQAQPAEPSPAGSVSSPTKKSAP